MGGIAFLGAAVGAVGTRVIDAEINAIQEVKKDSRNNIMALFEGMPSVLSLFRTQSPEQQHQDLLEKAKLSRQKLEEKFRKNVRHRFAPLDSSMGRAIRRVLTKSLPSLILVVAGAFIMNYLNGNAWSWPDSIYYALVTGTHAIGVEVTLSIWRNSYGNLQY
jgi:hypothetical protein